MPEAAAADPSAHKRTLAWGRETARKLWDNTFSRFEVDWPGATTLDFGCSWGYLARLLIEEQGVAASHGVDLAPMWRNMTDGSQPELIDGLHLHAGDILEIPEIQDAAFDAIVSAGTIFLLPPTYMKAVIQWFHDHLRPGGVALLRTRTFMSPSGADIQNHVKSEAAHLVFPRRVYDAWLEARGLPPSRRMAPFCAATYLMLYQRCGFAIEKVVRHGNRLPQAAMARYPDRFALYDEREIATSEVTAMLRRPARQRSFDAFDEWKGGG